MCFQGSLGRFAASVSLHSGCTYITGTFICRHIKEVFIKDVRQTETDHALMLMEQPFTEERTCNCIFGNHWEWYLFLNVECSQKSGSGNVLFSKVNSPQANRKQSSIDC